MVDIDPHFGAELKDGFKPVNAWIATGIGWLDEVQQFYRERAAIEKDYAGRLSALARRYFEKKARKSSILSVGETPTVTPGSLECASMTTWQIQLTTLENRAAEHEQFSQQLVADIAEPLKQLAARYEELRKCHGDYAAKLERERDATQLDLKRIKGKYDNVCQEVESRRKKSDGAFDHGKAKARALFEQQQAEMRNSSYIISVNVANKQKENYYHEYVPELLDYMQDLAETRVAKLNQIWSLAVQTEIDTLDHSAEFLSHLASEIPRNSPKLDSMMFARHNVAEWQDPPDSVFEASTVWHDDDTIPDDATTKIFLINILTKSKGLLGELKGQLGEKERAVQNAKKARDLIREGKDTRDEVECVRAILSLQEQMHQVRHQKTTAEVQISTITSAVGDVSIGARNHNFKAQTFKMPTNCDHCGDRIWGLSAKGFDCQDCGHTCHSKCKMKVPADCPGELSKEERKRLKARRQEDAKSSMASIGATELQQDLPQLGRSDTVNSMNTLSSGYSAAAQGTMSGTTEAADEQPSRGRSVTATRKNRVIAPPPAQYIKAPDSSVPSDGNARRTNEPKGRMLYAYQATGEGEISLGDGADVAIVEPDDGFGWMKVRSGHDEGLVPASYVEALPTSPVRRGSTYSNSTASVADSIAAAVTGKKKGPAVAPKRGAKKLKYAQALYDYEARSDAEHTIAEGERFVLVNMHAGDGWADVEKGGLVKNVPANYIQEV